MIPDSGTSLYTYAFENGTCLESVTIPERLLGETEIHSSIPVQNKSDVIATLKASGKLDVIRNDKGVTVTPSYKNIKDLTGMMETLVFYSSADNYTKAVNELFRYEPTARAAISLPELQAQSWTATCSTRLNL